MKEEGRGRSWGGAFRRAGLLEGMISKGVVSKGVAWSSGFRSRVRVRGAAVRASHFSEWKGGHGMF